MDIGKAWDLTYAADNPVMQMMKLANSRDTRIRGLLNKLQMAAQEFHTCPSQDSSEFSRRNRREVCREKLPLSSQEADA